MGLALSERNSRTPDRTHNVLSGVSLAHFQGSLHGVPPERRLMVKGKGPDSVKQGNKRKSIKLSLDNGRNGSVWVSIS